MEHNKRQWFTLLSVSVGLFVVAVPVFAHHGTAVSYQMDQHIEMTGVVTEWVFRSPHIQLHLDVTDEKRRGGPLGCRREAACIIGRGAGWNRDSVKPGDEVVVTFSPSKAGTHVGVMSKLILPSGEKACSINPRLGDDDC